MKLFTSVNHPEVIDILRGGGIGILRTDTLYGVVARADDRSAVDRVYDLKGRDQAKSPIVLIGNTDQMFDRPSAGLEAFAATAWPGPVSIIVPSTLAPQWLRRENHSVAYRLPDNEALRQLLVTSGPLIAPSANPEGDPPAMNIHQARSYFGDAVDFYVDGGEVTDDTPSKLVKVNPDGTVERLR